MDQDHKQERRNDIRHYCNSRILILTLLLQQDMGYTLDDFKKALLPILGNGKAMEQILRNFSLNAQLAIEYSNDDIVVKGTDLLRIIHINDKAIYKCKMWNGDVYELNESDFRHATDGEKNTFHTKQVDFIRTNIAPFLNFFSMRQLAGQVKEETAKASMDKQLNTIEQDCFTKLQDIKKLW